MKNACYTVMSHPIPGILHFGDFLLYGKIKFG